MFVDTTEQSEALIIQDEMFSNLLHHWNMHNCVGLDGIHPMVLKELEEGLIKTVNQQSS